MLHEPGEQYSTGTEVSGGHGILPRDAISPRLSVPNAERIVFIRHALRAGFTIEEICNLTKINRCFLTQSKEIVDFEEDAFHVPLTEVVFSCFQSPKGGAHGLIEAASRKS